ncbi:DUF1579 family protein [Devosia rhizoryzae]|uniref:DUF1579 family protein n=1 Tax=Devosia rhizoryzae TaxID=2774137 RepID=A0ABX7CBJ0_9HYPH|nr:DUF1579 family protein [Devosia rhizoryzae]QQR40554.1 DUF1579 family protein [Devosia rhizoryzae]
MADPRLAALEPLIGTWRTTITMLDANGNAGAVSVATDTYRRSANNMFVLHDVDAQMDGDRALSMEIIALDPSGKGYVTRSYDPDGTFSDFTASLEGKRWQIIGTKQRFDGNFSSEGQTLTGRWEQNIGNQWSPLMQVELRKQP